MSQASLFDVPVTRGSARKRDRATAQDAAKSMSGDVLNKQQMEVLRAAIRCEHGLTAYEAEQQLGYQQNVMSKRLGEVEQMHYLERRYGWIAGEKKYESRPGRSGRQCDVYRATDYGREIAQGVETVETGSYL